MNQEGKTTILVRYQETDQMGVVYHSNYLVWFEVGRTQFIKQFGLNYKEFEKKGLLLPVVEANCRYITPARFDDEVEVLTQLSTLEGSKIIFDYKIHRKKDQQLLATGTTKHVWVNHEMKRVDLEKLFPEVYQLLLIKHDD